MPSTRRRFLTTGVGGLLAVTGAGCLTKGTQRGVVDVIVHNDTDAQTEFSLTVTQTDGDSLIDETRTLPAGETTTYENQVAMKQTVTIDVSTTSGQQATKEWDVSITLHVRLQDDGIEFDEET